MTVSEFDYTAWTDGACKGNPGPGGWGVVWARDGAVWKLASGGEYQTTNNRMELMAMLHAVTDAPHKGNATMEVISDSQYVVNSINKNWAKNTHADLWEPLDYILSISDITVTWVKGHSGDIYNDMADHLASSTAQRMKEWRACTIPRILKRGGPKYLKNLDSKSPTIGKKP